VTEKTDAGQKLERFEDLARLLLRVPKREVDAAREAEKAAARREWRRATP
jgi:hypothetical protein